MCLSTSKWVHLNGGDGALRRLFRRVHALLRPGGLFVFEPQPWSSYRKRSGLTPTIRHHYETIAIRPSGFIRLLVEEVGFTSCETLKVPYERSEAKFAQGARGGARRPLLVLVK